jgi:hypothetical protein
MIAFLIRQAEQAFFEIGVLLVPQGERKAEVLKPVAVTRQPIFVPAVRAAACVVMREVIPRVAAGAVIFADCSPRTLGQIRSPVLPVGLASRAGAQTKMFGGQILRHNHAFLKLAAKSKDRAMLPQGRATVHGPQIEWQPAGGSPAWRGHETVSIQPGKNWFDLPIVGESRYPEVMFSCSLTARYVHPGGDKTRSTRVPDRPGL